MAVARCPQDDTARCKLLFLSFLQLDEGELNRLREYVKERRRQYREQAGMYNRASANLGTRSKTAAGAPRALNKREKRKLRAFGKGAGAGGRPITPAPGTRSAAARSELKTVTSSKNRGMSEDDWTLHAKEPVSLITQTGFRTMENEVQIRCQTPFAVY